MSKTVKLEASEIETDYDDRVFKRGEIYYVDIEDINKVTTHISHKIRPALIIQNDKGNVMSSNVIVALISSTIKREYPFQYHTSLNGRNSIIMFDQILTLDKWRIKEKHSELTLSQLAEAEQKLMYSLQLSRQSIANLRGLSIESMVTKKTVMEERTYFEIKLMYQRNSPETVVIELDVLKRFDATIDKDMDFPILKNKLDCCEGLNFLMNNCEFQE